MERARHDESMSAQEKAWLDAYRKGDLDALRRLCEHTRRPLYGFILKMLEGRGDPDDVFQETWLRAIRHLDSYRHKNFKSWLFRIAHNVIIDRSRRQKRYVDVHDASGRDPIEESVIDTGIPPDRTTEGRDLGTRISQALEQIPTEQRVVFLMRTQGEVPFKEIAEIENISINTALARMQYALRKLRDLLGEDYAELSKGN